MRSLSVILLAVFGSLLLLGCEPGKPRPISTEATWAKTYGGAGDDRAYSIQQTSDSGYIAAGDTYSFGAGGSDFWVLKLASDGTIPFNPSSGAQMADTNAVPVETNCTVADTAATVTDTTATVTDTDCTVTDTDATVQQQAP